MDPNATLREIRAIVKGADEDGCLGSIEQARLVDLWEALDGWLSNGGFLPKDWSPKR
jgi:hypothetical protein